MIGKPKPEIDVQKDGRVILRGNAYKKMRLELKGIAKGKCELCGRHCENGDPHHINGRGGGKRDESHFREWRKKYAVRLPAVSLR